ncbi:MAG: phenylalanine--tRNA ligase subunit beta [Hyphomicrobiales bacterium]|nr:phenylalanine--tRNA ligase subunit beta [Hyphomicrobiales bacterium]MDE2114253.1 phenylalanine--tRNA ligase subunit beta [Hyphomicrobiales bacterium]
MKLTLSWLKEHLDTHASLEQITDRLTKIGLEVEGIEDPALKLQGFGIAYVVSAEKHPNADKLRVCMVDDGSGKPVQVVCGAPNARAGMKSVFSPAGTFIPGKNITLAKGVIRGVESNGMLCSAAELELSNDHDGIIDLPADAPVGMAYGQYLGLNDPVIDINLTPNRPDAAGIYGIARDLEAAGIGTLKSSPIADIPGTYPCPTQVELLGEASDCPKFVLRQVRGVKNGPSPEWLQKQLKSIGLRPINALVDITNFMTFDRARPLHVFDADKVQGALRVRSAQADETLVALDGKTYTLEAGMIVICDENGPESIAGVMGGEASGCDENTVNVLIESALWDPAKIARTGRRLGINSDARYRFERGVDPAFCEAGAQMATAMVLEFCGGEASQLEIAVPAAAKPAMPLTLDFPFSEVKRLTGLNLAVDEMCGTLTALGFGVAARDAEHALVTVPSWRPDIEGKADIVEEILRIAGLDRVQPQPLPRLQDGVPTPVLTLLQKRKRTAQRALASLGLIEAVTWSFVSQPQAALFGGGDASLALANPIAADLSDMRPSLLPGLLMAVQRNSDRGLGDVALFEVGQIFRSDDEKGQKLNAAALRKGEAKSRGTGRHWSEKAQNVDFYDAKADALSLLAALNIPAASVQIVAGGPAWFHPGRSATLQFGPKNIVGAVGELHPLVLEAFGANGPVVAFELTLDDLPAPKLKATRAKPKLVMADLMPLERDFAFVVDRATAAGDIIKAAQNAERQIITKVTLFDVYEGTGIAADKKSIAIAVTMQPRDKTMTDGEIEALSGLIVAEVTKKTGAVLRG